MGAIATDTVTYKINALGQRVQKSGAGAYLYSNVATIDAAGHSPLARSIAYNARFVYDEQGRLIGEYTPEGKLISETVWFNGLPIATLRPKGANAGTPLGLSGTTTGNPVIGATAANANNAGNNSTANRVNAEIFYIHPDHLGTPRVVTRSTVATGANAPSTTLPTPQTAPGAINKATWRRESDPFGSLLGNAAPNENPQQITGTALQQQAASFVYDEMFPGQHRDRESGKFYNYFRDYDSAVGRYTASDPIGLEGGVNSYVYVENDPLGADDEDGLAPCIKFRGVKLCLPDKPAKPPPAKPPGRPGPQDKDRAIRDPAKKPANWSCNARADCNDNQPGNCPEDPWKRFAFGGGIGKNLGEARNIAKSNATHNLGCQPKHVSCVCTDSKGGIYRGGC